MSDNNNRPRAGEVEERAETLSVDGKRLRSRIPYGTESRDMGGWTEIVEPGALRATNLDELVATVDHAGVPIGRYPKTLSLEDRSDGLHWAVSLPESRADVREAVERGDLQAGSWRMVVGKESWDGDTRHVHEISELRDVAIVSSPAYPSATAELRTTPPSSATAADGQRKDVSMDNEKAGADDGATEERSESPETSEKVEARVVSEPEPALRVEDRNERAFAHSLTEEFRSRGFPANRAELSADEFRAVTWGGTINALNQAHVAGVPFGYDERWAWQVPPQESVDAGVTSVEVFQQTARTVVAGTASVRAIDATSAKPEAASTLNVTTVAMKQVANVQSGIPNVYLERSELATVVENDLRLGVFTGLDKLVVDGLGTSGFQAPGGDVFAVSVRKAITTLRASGYTPDTLALTPAASEGLDTLVSGLTGGTADFVSGLGQYAPTLFGLNKVECKSIAAPVVWDSKAHGKMYVSPVSLARFEESAGSTNTSLVRLETHAAYGVERTAAAVRIAAS